MPTSKTRKHRESKIRPPGKIHGGKGDGKARQIIAIHPDASEYEKHVEPFGGLASVKLNLADRDTAAGERPRIDIYNDGDERLSQMFKVMRDKPKELARLLDATMKDENDFNVCLSRDKWKRCNALEKARRTIVVYSQSFSGRTAHFARSNRRTRRDMASEVSSWLSRKSEVIPAIMRAIEKWEIQNLDGLDCIRMHDQKRNADGTQEKPRVMFYLDPPYLHSTRAPGAQKVYREFEMSDEAHESMLRLLLKVRGKILLSGYESDLYTKYLAKAAGWHMVAWKVKNQTTGPGTKRPTVVECCWMNYPIPKPLPKGMQQIY